MNRASQSVSGWDASDGWFSQVGQKIRTFGETPRWGAMGPTTHFWSIAGSFRPSVEETRVSLQRTDASVQMVFIAVRWFDG